MVLKVKRVLIIFGQQRNKLHFILQYYIYIFILIYYFVIIIIMTLYNIAVFTNTKIQLW